jgi:oxygen-independent coproporphyrinogen-3 oxidase
MVEASCRRLLDGGLMVNVDLIYGLPGQTPDDFQRDFAAVAGFGVQSVTAYNLRVNERTPVARSLAADERLDLAGGAGATVMWRCARARIRPCRWHTFQRIGKGRRQRWSAVSMTSLDTAPVQRRNERAVPVDHVVFRNTWLRAYLNASKAAEACGGDARPSPSRSCGS